MVTCSWCLVLAGMADMAVRIVRVGAGRMNCRCQLQVCNICSEGELDAHKYQCLQSICVGSLETSELE
jgi:hypothetical protein